MNFENGIVLLEEVSPDQIEVEVETSETFLLNPLLDHNYNQQEQTEPTKSVLPRNIKIRELKALYHCKRCGFSTFKKDTMDAHSRTHMEKQKIIEDKRRYIPCPSCTTKKQREEYEKCPECSYYTKKESSLKIHMRIHMKDKPYKCTECEHRVENLKELIKHYEEKHRGVDKYRCHTCNFTTHSRGALSSHYQSHGEALTCSVCSYSTDHKANMARHVKKHYLKLNKT